MSRLRYFLSETAVSLRRNALMTTAAISTVAISLLLLGGVQILGLLVNRLTATWEAKVEVSVFLREDATQGEVQNLEGEVSNYPGVENVTFISSAQALEEFKEIYRDQPELWQVLGPNDLPASLRVELRDASDSEEVAQNIEGAPGVDDVRYGGEFIRRLLRVNSLLRAVTLALSVILLLAAGALIANTIRLTIFARRNEIEIMRLVGATNWFIRIPFMMEGLVAGLLGAVISSGVLLTADWLVFSRLPQTLPFLSTVLSFSTGELLGIAIVSLAVGAGIGVFGSVIAVRRTLQV